MLRLDAHTTVKLIKECQKPPMDTENVGIFGAGWIYRIYKCCNISWEITLPSKTVYSFNLDNLGLWIKNLDHWEPWFSVPDQWP